MKNIDAIFQELAQEVKNNPDKIKDLDGTLQFNITGDGGGTYYVTIKSETFKLCQGESEKADVIITLNIEDLSRLIEGKLNPVMGFMTGKLKIEGDMSLALKLQSLF